MNKAFTWFAWKNEPSHDTPLSAANLNKINDALNIVDNRVVAQDTAIAAKYTKPDSGIPESDLSANVKATLDNSIFFEED